MNSRMRKDVTCLWWNSTFGKNLRYIRKKRKLTLMKMAELAGIKYQQVGKYELGVDQMSAYRLMQFANILKVKIKYLFDPEYINKMKGYHQDRVFHAAMPPEMMDIDQLQANAAEALDAAEIQAHI